MSESVTGGVLDHPGRMAYITAKDVVLYPHYIRFFGSAAVISRSERLPELVGQLGL